LQTDREEGQPMAKKLKAIEVSAVDNSSLLWKLDECEKLQKQKDKTFEIMADHLQIMEKLLNQATEAKSKGDFTMKLLDGKLKYRTFRVVYFIELYFFF